MASPYIHVQFRAVDTRAFDRRLNVKMNDDEGRVLVRRDDIFFFRLLQ